MHFTVEPEAGQAAVRQQSGTTRVRPGTAQEAEYGSGSRARYDSGRARYDSGSRADCEAGTGYGHGWKCASMMSENQAATDASQAATDASQAATDASQAAVASHAG